MASYSYGIDFGTTNSTMVSYNKDKHEFSNMAQPISSTVMYHDGKVTVGQEVREKIYKYAGVAGYHFEKSIKLRLGTDKISNVFGKKVKPSEVATEIIKNLKKKHQEFKDDSTNNVTFTVPINFSGKARRDLRKAANDAGIEVATFIHEPFAAVVGYYFTKSKKTSCPAVIDELQKIDDEYLLTFDWGGGTLDITVVRLKDKKMFEVGTAALTNMAGDKFDELLATYAWNKIAECEKTLLEKTREEKWGNLLAEAEQVKIDLSSKKSSQFKFDLEDSSYVTTITRGEFENIISESHILDKALDKVDEAINQAGIDSVQISKVLLTGGTSYIPVVQKRMVEKFGDRVEKVVGPEFLIAQGAAVISELKWVPYLSKAVSIEMCDNSFFDLFAQGNLIVSGANNKKEEEFVCVDQRRKNAKVIFKERFDNKVGETLEILNVPTLGNANFGDDIIVSGTIDRDIVLQVSAYSKMVDNPNDKTKQSTRINKEIYKLCFGLNIEGLVEWNDGNIVAPDKYVVYNGKYYLNVGKEPITIVLKGENSTPTPEKNKLNFKEA